MLPTVQNGDTLALAGFEGEAANAERGSDIRSVTYCNCSRLGAFLLVPLLHCKVGDLLPRASKTIKHLAIYAQAHSPDLAREIAWT